MGLAAMDPGFFPIHPGIEDDRQCVRRGRLRRSPGLCAQRDFGIAALFEGRRERQVIALVLGPRSYRIGDAVAIASLRVGDTVSNLSRCGFRQSKSRCQKQDGEHERIPSRLPLANSFYQKRGSMASRYAGRTVRILAS